MAWRQLLVIVAFLFSSTSYAFEGFDHKKLSTEGKSYVERLTQVICLDPMDQHAYLYCQGVKKDQNIIDDLINNNPSPSWNRWDPISPSYVVNVDIDEYKEEAKKIESRDLIEATKHPFQHIRVSAFQALVLAYPEIDVIPLLIAHINDNALVKRNEYDIASDQKVGDIFFHIATHTPALTKLNFTKFDRQQRKQVLDALVSTPNQLDATSELILFLNADP